MSRPFIELSALVADPFGTLARARHQHWLADTDGGAVAAPRSCTTTTPRRKRSSPPR